MLARIPRLEDYDVSPLTGFLPEELPARHLESQYYRPWEQIAENLAAFIMSGSLGRAVDALPTLSIDEIRNDVCQLRRAFSILGFIAHGYIWTGNNGKPNEHVPSQISEPWIQIAEILKVPPVANYAALCLWNHHTLFDGLTPNEWDLSNLATNTTFTGCLDESWFYLVSTVLERQGAPCLTAGIQAIQSCRDDDVDGVILALQQLAEGIDGLIVTLGRMYEQCDPHFFYNRLRPFLAGSKNMADAGLPNGVRYGNEKKYRHYSGGSNAQSSLIQALDIILNIQHRPTGERAPLPKTLLSNNKQQQATSGTKTPSRNNFIHEMREYMPGQHCEFLIALNRVACIRDFVESKKLSSLTLAYDACLSVLRSFRDKHVQIVTRYIILQTRNSNTPSPIGPRRQGLANVEVNNDSTARGTGGTALLAFLRQARDETAEPCVGTWAQRLLRENPKPVHVNSKKSPDNPENLKYTTGLAEKWTDGCDQNDPTFIGGGGVCHW